MFTTMPPQSFSNKAQDKEWLRGEGKNARVCTTRVNTMCGSDKRRLLNLEWLKLIYQYLVTIED